MSININKKSIFIFTLVLMLYMSLMPSIPIGGYLDDLVPLIFFVIWLRYLTISKNTDREIKIFISLVGICALGVISNCTSGIVRSFSDIMLDMFSFLKMYFVFLGTKAIFINRENLINKTINYLSIFSKFFILISFAFGILHYLGIVSMGDLERFGFKTYAFIYGNASQFGILTGIALSFIIYDESKNRKWFTVLGLLTLIMTLKGMSLIIVGVYSTLYLLRVKKIRLWHIIVVGSILVFLLRFQIYGYLLNSSAPRAILLKYGCVTANRFFPLGAGFGTYGSEIAARHYSPLYFQYGFASREILTYVKGTALNDVYLGMIFGQFGWIGAVLFVYVFILIGNGILRNKKAENHSYIIAIALFACLSGMAIMAGSIKVAGGQLLLFSLQLFLCKYDNKPPRTIQGVRH